MITTVGGSKTSRPLLLSNETWQIRSEKNHENKPKTSNKKPNIVTLMTDDTGWNDFSCCDSTK